jgi:hypothetical protein
MEMSFARMEMSFIRTQITVPGALTELADQWQAVALTSDPAPLDLSTIFPGAMV